MSRPLENLLALAEPLIAAIRTASSVDVRPDAARALLDDQVRALRGAAERAHVPARDVEDLLYALAAHADEVMLARAGTREAWLPRLLQLALFGENNAGDGFFARLEGLRRDTSRGDVLLVYYVVLALGFRGRLAARDAERLELVESVHLDLLRLGAETDAALAPRASPARSRSGTPALDPRWSLAIGAGACVLAALTWALFAFDLWMHTSTALGG